MSDEAASPLKILVADDQQQIRQLLETRLRLQGHQPVMAGNGLEALDLFRSEQPDLVILDVMMPELDGFEVTERIRAQSDVPIILLTALDEVEQRIIGLNLGADDYMVKPFSPKELEVRINCVMRRCAVIPGEAATMPARMSQAVQVADLSIDLPRRQVYRDNDRIRLTEMEFNLLVLLLKQAGTAIQRQEMLERIWGYSPKRAGDCRVVDVHISRLRAKLELDPINPELILTVRGLGYMFQRLPDGLEVAFS